MSFPKAASDRLGRAPFAYGDGFDASVLSGAQLVVCNSLEGQTRARASYSGVIARYRFPHVTTFLEDDGLRERLPDAAYLHDSDGVRPSGPTWTWTDPSSADWRRELAQYFLDRAGEGASALYLDGSCDAPPAGIEPAAYFSERAAGLVAALRTGAVGVPILVNGALAVVNDPSRGGMQDGIDGRAFVLVGEALGWIADGLLAEDFWIEGSADGTGPLILDTPYRRWSSGMNAVLGMQARHPALSIVHLVKTEPLDAQGKIAARALFGICSTLLSKNDRTLLALQPTTEQPRKMPTVPYLGTPGAPPASIDVLRQADGTFMRVYPKAYVHVDAIKGEGWIEGKV